MGAMPGHDGSTTAGGGAGSIRALRQALPALKTYRPELFGMTLAINILGLALPVFILQVYDRVLPNAALTTLELMAVGLALALVLDAGLKVCRSWVTTWTGTQFEHLARLTAVERLLATSVEDFERDTPGALFDKINALNTVKDFHVIQMVTVLVDLPFALLFITLVWYLGGILVAVPLALLGLFSLMALLTGMSLRRAVARRADVDNRRYDFLMGLLAGIHTVKAMALRTLMLRRYDRLQEQSAKAMQEVTFKSTIAQSLGSLFSQLSMVSVIGFGAILVLDGSLSAGELAACTLLSSRALQPLQSAMGIWTNFQAVRVAAGKAASVLKLEAEAAPDLPPLEPVSGEVELRDVVFAYGDGEPFFDGLNLHIKAGEAIGIEGDNSSGRSTLMAVILGLRHLRSGQVLLDGKDISEFEPHTVRSQVSLMEQEPPIYAASILDNLTSFRSGAYIERALELSRALGIDEEVKRLPEGYETRIGDGAAEMLPLGFRQRVAIARDLADDPPVVLFDEANSALDAHSDDKLIRLLEFLKGRTTLIMVSARPSLLRLADRRFVMENGRLEEMPPQAARPRVGGPGR